MVKSFDASGVAMLVGMTDTRAGAQVFGMRPGCTELLSEVLYSESNLCRRYQLHVSQMLFAKEMSVKLSAVTSFKNSSRNMLLSLPSTHISCYSLFISAIERNYALLLY
jgi:hypothetical protein